MVKKIVYITLVVLVILLIAVWVAWKLFLAPETFHAVSLTSGEIYFGKLVTFPKFGLKQVYSFQVNAQNEDNPLSIQKFADAFWGPSDFLKINRDQVLWTVELDQEGQLSLLLKNNPDLRTQAQDQPAPFTNQTAPTTELEN